MELLTSQTDARKKKKLMEMKKKMSKLTKEQLKAAVEKKNLCNAKAMCVVERLIEPDVEEHWLLDNLFHINQSHYQDAVEERAITKSCGYPLCDASLEDVPKKQYHISTRHNKVFDITDRKNYCSNVCYKASIFLKEQLYTSPLWLRDCEEAVHYKLFSSTNKNGSTGVEIDLGNISPVNTEEYEKKTNKNLEVNDLRTSDLMKESFEAEVIKIPVSGNLNTPSGEHTDASQEIESSFSTDKIIQKQCISEDNESTVLIENVAESKVYNNDQKQRDRKQKAIRMKDRVRVKDRKDKRLLNVTDKVDFVLDSWITADSLSFLYGDVKLKEILEEYGTPTERFGRLRNTKDSFLYERYTEICKRLNFIELKEKVEERVEAIPSKPVPDFEQLKAQAQELEIKVKAFYLGDKKVSFQNDLEEDENKKSKDGKELGEFTEQPILPLLDKHSVLATRRRIVLDKVFKTLPDIQSALGLAQFNLRHEVLEFVHTLALSASNVTLSPPEWNLMSIIIIKLFTLRNELLDYAFKTDLTQKRIINLLLSYNLGLDYLQKCVSKLSNIEQIIRNSQWRK
ncbi:putative RNA polymerase II subunit B1 CTD phosphatase RPAP2 [Rhodnius prolixus]|uniref:putative RNA polymerase II subunit B1 CTD phosphatase RPAP2 n=1 Tax=Rhodnius prolixus TaxID=13249 RepID=UPI003D1887F9